MKYTIEKNKITVYDTEDFNIEHILECGQVFRYKKLDNCYEVYSLNHKATIFSQKVVTICCDDEKYFEKYFDFGRDYVIRRDGHDAEIVTIYQDPNVISHIRYVMVPVYNEEKDYTPFYFNDDESGYEILGIVDK